MDHAPILICYDGSEPARTAIRVAAGLLGPSPRDRARRGAPVHTCGALRRSGLGCQRGGIRARPRRRGRRAAAEGSDIARAAGFSATPRGSVAAPTWEEILDVADETRASAIVIGSHGRTGVREFVVGSVSHDLMQHSSLPVLVVPPQTRRH